MYTMNDICIQCTIKLNWIKKTKGTFLVFYIGAVFFILRYAVGMRKYDMVHKFDVNGYPKEYYNSWVFLTLLSLRR